MPAAYYDFNVEQSSDFVSGLKILKPDTGQLFKFLPNPNQPFWITESVLGFDVPNEIKLKYPNNDLSFGYLKNQNALTFLKIRMNIRGGSSSTNLITASTSIVKNANGTSYTIIKSPVEPENPNTAPTNIAFFDFLTNQENNILLTIPNRTTNQYKGRYLYDIELEYKLGDITKTTESVLLPFVIRLLQGRITFNPNITVSD